MADLAKIVSANPFNEGAAAVVNPVCVNLSIAVDSVRGKVPVDEWTLTNDRVANKWKNNDTYQT